MGLFSKILSTRSGYDVSTEDTLTELIAYCLKLDHNIARQFLSHFNIIDSSEEAFSIRTQVKLGRLLEHKKGSVVDMVLSNNNHTIFIENKLNSNEGELQLKRYAEHLWHTQTPFKTLLYITKNPEPKEERRIVSKRRSTKISFQQLRWYKVYEFFYQYKAHPIISEVLQFMVDLNLTSRYEFTSFDIEVLANYPRLLSMMDKVLMGKVNRAFTEIIGNNKDKIVPSLEIREHNRYILYAKKNNNISIILGFLFAPTYQPPAIPKVSFNIEMGEKENFQNDNDLILRHQFIDLLEEKDGTKEGNLMWELYGYSYSSDQTWKGIGISKNLYEFHVGGNHIKEIEDFFLSCLEAYKTIKPDIKHYL